MAHRVSKGKTSRRTASKSTEGEHQGQTAARGGDAPAGLERARTGRAFHRPTAAVRKRLTKAAADKGFAEPDVLLRWSEAVGAHLADLCQPVKVSYGGSLGATLLVRVDSGRAPEVMHREPQIVERINQFYGYKAISRLRLTQATGLPGQPGFAEGGAAFDHGGAPQKPSQPRSEALARAAAMTGDVQNPALREALTRLGGWVLSNSPNTRSQETLK
ncbi:MAG: DUF721 domain-containing protein [Pseudomonadota bacterium]